MVEASPASERESTQAPYLTFLAVGVVAVSLAAIFIRLAQDAATPSLLIATGRLVLAAMILTPVVLRRPHYLNQIRQLNRSELLLAVVSGVFLAIHFGTWVTSLEHTSVLISVVLVTTTPIWVAILEVAFLRTRLARHVIAGLVVAFIGGIVISVGSGEGVEGGARGNLYGAFLAIVGAVTVAVYLVIGRRLRATLALTPYIWIVYGCAALVMCAVLLFTRTSVLGHDLVGYLWIVALALIPQLVGHSSFNYALAYLPATYVGIATQLEPVLSALAAAVVFAEIPTVGEVLGGLLIITGVSIAIFGRRRV